MTTASHLLGHTQVMDLSGSGPLGRVLVSTLCLKHRLLAAGGFSGELVVQSLSEDRRPVRCSPPDTVELHVKRDQQRLALPRGVHLPEACWRSWVPVNARNDGRSCGLRRDDMCGSTGLAVLRERMCGGALSAAPQALSCCAQPPGDDERERHHERDRDLQDGRRRDARRDLQQRQRAAVAGPGGAEDHLVRLRLLSAPRNASLSSLAFYTSHAIQSHVLQGAYKSIRAIDHRRNSCGWLASLRM